MRFNCREICFDLRRFYEYFSWCFWGPVKKRLMGKKLVIWILKKVTIFYLLYFVLREKIVTSELLVLQCRELPYIYEIKNSLYRQRLFFPALNFQLYDPSASFNQSNIKSGSVKYFQLEIKPCRLGSRIWDVKAFWYKTEIKMIYFVPLCLILLIFSDCIVFLNIKNLGSG
jgi:hypothetical protein